MRHFKLTPTADADIAAIHEHVFSQDAYTASLVVDRIEQTIESVCLFPHMGKPTKQPGVWVFAGSARSPFRITYRFDDEFVSVVRVIRGRRQNA